MQKVMKYTKMNISKMEKRFPKKALEQQKKDFVVLFLLSGLGCLMVVLLSKYKEVSIVIYLVGGKAVSEKRYNEILEKYCKRIPSERIKRFGDI